MEKKPYQKLLSCWWLSLDTEADNARSNPSLFAKLSSEKYTSNNPGHHGTAVRPAKALNADQKTKQYDHKERKSEFNLCNDLDSSGNYSKSVKNCGIIKEAIQKFKQFLAATHKNGCSDPSCVYNERIHTLKVSFKIDDKKKSLVKIPMKRRKKRQTGLLQDNLSNN